MAGVSMEVHRRAPLASSLALALAACQSAPAPAVDGGPPTSATAPAASAYAPTEHRPAPVREGGALVRSASDDALFVADEDHRVVRVVPLPLDAARPAAV